MGTLFKLNYYHNRLYKPLEEKYLKPLAKLDIIITRNLREAGIHTRPARANGLWCFTLLPTVLILYSLLYEVSQAYKLAACLSVGLLFYGVLFNVFMSISSLVFTHEVGGGCLASGMIASTLVYHVVKQDILFVGIFALPSPLFFSRVLRRLLACPRTFTIGEAMIVAQSVVISTIVMVAMVTCDLGDNTEVDLVNTVVITALSTVGLIVTAINMLSQEARTMKNLSFIIMAAAGFALTCLHVALGFDSLERVFMFLFMDETRIKLITFWATLVVLAVLVLVIRTCMKGKASTGTRKTFHILAAAVFASGILLDLRLLEMAAGVVFGLLILVEAMRKSGIEPISSALQSAFLVYSDEKDCGEFAVTPIYMYCGLGAGLLAARGAPAPERLGGVLAVGVGDAAAAHLGASLGRTRWPGQNRTVEGTLFNIASQILTVYCLSLFELINCENAVLRTAVAATVSSLVEANTDQVDNLILPLVTLIAFQTTKWMS